MTICFPLCLCIAKHSIHHYRLPACWQQNAVLAALLPLRVYTVASLTCELRMHLRSYFEKRFPALFLTCYDFALRRLTEEASMKEYFPPDAQSLMAPFFAGHAASQVRAGRLHPRPLEIHWRTCPHSQPKHAHALA